jgi:hypothetical protein
MKFLYHSLSNEVEENQVGAHGGHNWMMMAYCIPMIIIALAPVVTGVVSAAFLVYAVACLLVMGAMTKMMDHGAMEM